MNTDFRAGHKLWVEIQKRSKKAKRLTACVGYVGRNPADVLRWRKGDSLVADISEETVARGICSARGALKLLNLGVKVFHSPRLHAKVYLFDTSAIVCSANASESSMTRREAGMVVSGARLGPVRAWVAGLSASHDTVRLDRALLKALAKKEPKEPAKPNNANAKKHHVRKAILGTVWLLGAQVRVPAHADH